MLVEAAAADRAEVAAFSLRLRNVEATLAMAAPLGWLLEEEVLRRPDRVSAGKGGDALRRSSKQ